VCDVCLYVCAFEQMLKGGELFERIVGKPRFTEVRECSGRVNFLLTLKLYWLQPQAAKLIRPLLESVAYLHDMGIVHR